MSSRRPAASTVSASSGRFWRIVIPLSVPGLAVTAFFAFITAWNEFLFARSFLTSKDALTLPVGMATLHRPVQPAMGSVDRRVRC